MIFIEIQAIEMKGFFSPSRIGCFDDGKFEVAFGKRIKGWRNLITGLFFIRKEPNMPKKP